MAPALGIVAVAALGLASTLHAAPDADRTVRQVHFETASSTAVLTGSIRGRRTIDYQLRAFAGQTLKVAMQAGNRANYFNVLPPESRDVAMFVEGAGERAFDSLLPDDGVYTVRVYLVRAAARRNEGSRFTLSIEVTGTPLAPLSANVDALVPGTRFHATSKVACQPPFSNERACDALVVRRGTDGTATVELRWKEGSRQRFLFVRGSPVASDLRWPFTFARDATGTTVIFGRDERFEIPEALIYGG